MKQMIMNRMALVCVLTASLTSPLLFGCAHEVSHTERSRVSSDGTVTTTEESRTTSR
jgi:hypothetical protein